ncbi:hypothetical protein H9I48_05005 [Wolbachia pipientis]|uniref:hypothetical protein n=1 Tax=Wolbachia pipientis TaxID=955 RepID=UPI0016518C55|nr:hypothetical protein [Wolbachia pipientis]MBC6686557.1 hypothetical protein [Wolbachia pipientis]
MNKKHCFKINKLVRVHTTEIIRSHGIIVYERVMEKDEQIEEKRISKKQERGGFENRIYNIYIEVNSKSIDYYHKKPSDYPEIIVV